MSCLYNCRLKQKSRKRDDAERRKVEKSVRELEKGEGHVTLDQVKDMFSDVPAGVEEVVLTLLNSPGDAVKTRFLHTWFVEDHGDAVYHGAVLKLKKTKRCTFVVAYYMVGEGVEESVENVPRSTLVVDALYGDLVPS